MLGLNAILPVAHDGSPYGLWLAGAVAIGLITSWVNGWDK